MTAERDYADEAKAKEIAKEISRAVNRISSGRGTLEALAEELSTDHRTLQQGIMAGLVVPLLRLWAADFESGHYDDRNEATVKAAYAAIEWIDKASPGFPFI